MSQYTLGAGSVVSIDGTPTFAITRVPSSMSPTEQEEMAQRIVRLLNYDDSIFDGDRITVCSNDDCEQEFLETQLAPIKNFFMRVGAGDTCPAGQCPKCGALCYLKHVSLRELRGIKIDAAHTF